MLKNLQSVFEDKFKPFLFKEHSDDQLEFNNKKAAHNACITHSSNMFVMSGDVANTNSDYTAAQKKHEKCRKSEKSWKAYKNLPLESEDASTLHEIDQHHENLCSAMNLAKIHAQEYADVKPVGTKRACGMEQLAYEEKFCLWRAARFYTCKGLEDCITQVGLSNLQRLLLTRSDSRRALWGAGEKLLCQIGHLLGTVNKSSQSGNNVNDTCDNVTSETAKFELTMDVPSHDACSNSNPVTLPGGTTCADWIAQEYSWSVSTHVIPASCEATCPVIAAKPYQPGASCEGEPAKCAFYSYHPKACGQHDTSSFVAKEKCCACTTTTTTAAPTWVQCARLTSQKGTAVDAVHGVDGSTYLSSSWGAQDFSVQGAIGNHCPDVANPKAVKFKVLDGNFNMKIETGAFVLTENVFVTKMGLFKATNDLGAVFHFNIVRDKDTKLIDSNRCQRVWSNGNWHRTILCVSAGGNYQSLVGGINKDKPEEKNGPYMCKLNAMCGFESKNMIEIYMENSLD